MSTSMREALESAKSWIERWTSHVGNCRDGNECTCGRTAILAECAAALSSPADAERLALAERADNLRRCVQTLRPYTGHPIGSPGSAARRDQQERADAHQAAIAIIDQIAADYQNLRDPVVVHINMLRGTIAKPTWPQIEHLYPDDVAALRAVHRQK